VSTTDTSGVLAPLPLPAEGLVGSINSTVRTILRDCQVAGINFLEVVAWQAQLQHTSKKWVRDHLLLLLSSYRTVFNCC
jgi:hypothetical protein